MMIDRFLAYILETESSKKDWWKVNFEKKTKWHDISTYLEELREFRKWKIVFDFINEGWGQNN